MNRIFFIMNRAGRVWPRQRVSGMGWAGRAAVLAAMVVLSAPLIVLIAMALMTGLLVFVWVGLVVKTVRGLSDFWFKLKSRVGGASRLSRGQPETIHVRVVRRGA